LLRQKPQHCRREHPNIRRIVASHTSHPQALLRQRPQHEPSQTPKHPQGAFGWFSFAAKSSAFNFSTLEPLGAEEELPPELPEPAAVGFGIFLAGMGAFSAGTRSVVVASSSSKSAGISSSLSVQQAFSGGLLGIRSASRKGSGNSPCKMPLVAFGNGKPPTIGTAEAPHLLLAASIFGLGEAGRNFFEGGNIARVALLHAARIFGLCGCNITHTHTHTQTNKQTHTNTQTHTHTNHQS
jgi:hypothetical protein